MPTYTLVYGSADIDEIEILEMESCKNCHNLKVQVSTEMAIKVSSVRCEHCIILLFHKPSCRRLFPLTDHEVCDNSEENDRENPLRENITEDLGKKVGRYSVITADGFMTAKYTDGRIIERKYSTR